MAEKELWGTTKTSAQLQNQLIGFEQKPFHVFAIPWWTPTVATPRNRPSSSKKKSRDGLIVGIISHEDIKQCVENSKRHWRPQSETHNIRNLGLDIGKNEQNGDLKTEWVNYSSRFLCVSRRIAFLWWWQIMCFWIFVSMRLFSSSKASSLAHPKSHFFPMIPMHVPFCLSPRPTLS